MFSLPHYPHADNEASSPFFFSGNNNSRGFLKEIVACGCSSSCYEIDFNFFLSPSPFSYHILGWFGGCVSKEDKGFHLVTKSSFIQICRSTSGVGKVDELVHVAIDTLDVDLWMRMCMSMSNSVWNICSYVHIRVLYEIYVWLCCMYVFPPQDRLILLTRPVFPYGVCWARSDRIHLKCQLPFHCASSLNGNEDSSGGFVLCFVVCGGGKGLLCL